MPWSPIRSWRELTRRLLPGLGKSQNNLSRAADKLTGDPTLDNQQIAEFIAKAIRACFASMEAGKPTSFALEIERFDPRLYDARKVTDASLNAAWWFADFYFDAKSEGFSKLGEVAWPEADRVMADLLNRLETGQELPPPESLK